jgi:hypothetical protein
MGHPILDLSFWKGHLGHPPIRCSQLAEPESTRTKTSQRRRRIKHARLYARRGLHPPLPLLAKTRRIARNRSQTPVCSSSFRMRPVNSSCARARAREVETGVITTLKRGASTLLCTGAEAPLHIGRFRHDQGRALIQGARIKRDASTECDGRSFPHGDTRAKPKSRSLAGKARS